MPYIQKEKNGTYTIKFYEIVDGKRIQRSKRGNKTQREANNYYIQYMAGKPERDAKAKQPQESKADTLTVGECFDEYKTYIEQNLKTSSRKSATDVLKLHVLPYFNDKAISKITPQDVVKWKTDINSKRYKFKYKSKIYCAFTALINYARKMYNIRDNPVSNMGNFKNMEAKKEMAFWTKEEFTKFISVVDIELYRIFFTFLYLSGCRKGEAMALSWNDVDFNTSVVHIRKNLNRKGLSNGQLYEITTPKTKAGNRDILLPETLIKLLKEHKKSCEKIDGFNNNSFVFGTSTPLVEQTIRRRLDEYALKAGVKKIRVHDLRHSHASLLISQGADILIVSQRLGHSDISETLNTYSHMFPNKQKTLIDGLNISI